MKSRKGFTLIEMMIVAAILGIVVAIVVPNCGLVTIAPNYSSGERTGVVVKLSQKGIIWKTWEGEMNIGSMSSDGNGVAVPTVFAFSVGDDALAQKIGEAARAGRRVTLAYKQALMRSRRQGDTPYLVVALR